MVATTVYSKRRPWPYDAYLGDVRVMLEPSGDGNLVSQRTKTLEATAPVDYTYSAANPYKEKAFEWQELYGGLGQATAPSDTKPRRYSHAQYADLSIDGLWMKGPKFENHSGHVHVETIGAGSGEIRQLIWALHGGILFLFAICQNGVYRRTADGTWVVSLSAATLGAGVYPQQALRFKHRGAGVVDALYVTTSTSNLWKYDGAAWTLAAAGAGPQNNEARYIEKVNDELWIAGDYTVCRVLDNPFTRANYGAAINVGDQTAKITWLRTLGDTLIIFKEDGVYTVDTTGLDHELFPTLRGKNDLFNGRNAAVWIDRVWFSYGAQTFTMNEEGTLKPDGMEQLLENESDIHGEWIAGAGHNTWFFYELYYNSNNNTTYLVKHGTWIEENSTQSTPGVAQFAEAHHGALYEWNARASFCDIIADVDSSGNDRLYVGFTDGTMQWTLLPKVSPNPSEDTNCEFTAFDSYVYLPVHHSSFRADNKLYHAVTAMGPKLAAYEYAEVQYRLDVSNTLASWVSVSPGLTQFTLPGQRLPMTNDPVSNAVYGKLIQFRVKLSKNPSESLSPLNMTPVIEGIVIHESIRPSFSREFTFNVKAASFLPRHDGLVDRRRGYQIRDALLEECARTRPVQIYLPTGEVEQLTLIDYKDAAASFSTRRDHEWLIQVQGIQLGTLTADEGDPGEVSSAITYTYLEAFTLTQLESII